jgi:glycosyltransferase involved in cell wall biosynthesis
MLRSYDEKGGVGVYTQNIVEELLRIDQANEYVLLYRDPRNLGRFGDFPNVSEVHVRAPGKALWDQIAVPIACRRHRIDVLFHPKFTAPLLAPSKVVMTVHGADWFIPEQAKFYTKLDVAYLKVWMPLYLRKCTTVISVSQLTTDNYNDVFSLPPGKVRTVYFGPARHFRRVEDPAEIARVRSRYDLPERFILTLTKRLGDGRKNLGNLLSAYALFHERDSAPTKLVVGGKDCHLFREEYAIPNSGYGADVVFPGWIDQADLPAVYSMAEMYLYPSNLEAFPIPITEAMSCGTPIVTSDANGLRELAEDAAMLVDPEDPEAIADAIGRVHADPDLRRGLRERGLERSQIFRWDKCARDTLEILTE